MFLAGDYEAQKLNNFEPHELYKTIEKHFLYSVLLSDNVVMPFGCYYQSEYMQIITEKYMDLFFPYKNRPRIAEYAIADDRGSFLDDVRVKATWFPEEYEYHDEQKIHTLIKKIDGISPLIRNGKMRKVLTGQISADIGRDGEARLILANTVESEEEARKIVEPLKIVIEEQKFAILPTYVEMVIDKYGLVKQSQKKWLDFILFKGYARSCETAYQGYCNNPLSIGYDDLFRQLYPYSIDFRDTCLFEIFVQLFPFKGLDEIERFDCSSLLKMKYSFDFQDYLHCYQKIVSSLNKELRYYILKAGNPYMNAMNAIENIRRKEYTYYMNKLTENTNDAIVLYRVLKNVPWKFHQFGKWLRNKDIDMPTIQLLSYIKDRQNGIFKDYIHELYCSVKNIKKERDKMMNMKNINFSIGGRVEQRIDINNASKKVSNASIISKDDFKAIDWNEFEKFFNLIEENDNQDLFEVKDNIIHLVSSGKYGTQEDYQNKLKGWEELRKKLPSATLEAIKTVAQLCSIGTFIVKLLRLGD